MMVLRASLYRIGWHCTRPRIRAFSRPTPARYLFSTTATQEPLTLSSDLTDSPIYVPSPPSAVNQLVHHSSSAPFLFYPAFLSSDEQAVLIRASLAKLDMSTGQSRDVRIRKDAWRKERNNAPYYGFLPDELYDFEEGHYDGVIHGYREMHLNSWPPDEAASLPNIPNAPRLSCIIAHLQNLFVSHLPDGTFNLRQEGNESAHIQTHLLHLGTSGAIGPHVDNIDASGSIIMGVSLGSPRIMRMTRTHNRERTHLPDAFDVLLLPGSVYVQRNEVRYDFDHSIVAEGIFRGELVPRGQRISIMMRDKKLPHAPQAQLPQPM